MHEKKKREREREIRLGRCFIEIPISDIVECKFSIRKYHTVKFFLFSRLNFSTFNFAKVEESNGAFAR